ncbi:MAG: type II toxin-antitoxin system VapC family toxin [Chloroflexi bacterium]|nr:type II toxin-antitoxin system VapC family toxin [Chloroflexota bacterium]
MYLLDTNVISELRRQRPNRSVVRWIEGVPAAQLYISAVTIGEIQDGIEQIREREFYKATEIESWLNDVQATYSVLPVDADAFREWAKLMQKQSRALLEDALIAATAIVNSLTVVTRNVRDFERLSVPILNPFDHRE